MVNERKQVVVIGGGISGLATAFWLQQKSCRVTVLERSKRVGGVIRSQRINAYTIDHAAHCLLNYLPEVNYLIETVGLAGVQVFRDAGANKRYLLKQGKPQSVPLTPKELALSSFWSWKAKLRMAIEPFIPASKHTAEESVAAFIQRRFGREMLEQAIDPFIAGTLSGDPDRACVQSVMPKFYGLEQQYGSIIRGIIANKLNGIHTCYPNTLFSFRDGMESLPMAIAGHLGDKVLTGIDVNTIKRTGRKWVVAADCAGDALHMECDAVVMATPAPSAACLLEPLSGVLAGQLKGIVYAPMAVLALGFRKQDVSHPLDGMGCLIPGREKKSLLGTLWSSSLFAHRAADGRILITCYMGGMRQPDMLEYDDQRLLDFAMADLRDMLGIDGEPQFVRVIRHAQGLPQYHLGHLQRLATIDEQLRLLPGLYLTGNYLDGVSIRDRIVQGKRLAGQVLREISNHERFSDVGNGSGQSRPDRHSYCHVRQVGGNQIRSTSK